MPVTVTADPQFKTVGQPDPPLTYQVTSGTVEAGDSITGALTRDAGDTSGTYAIKKGTLALNPTNYSLSYVRANLTITTATLLTVTGITASDKPYDGTTTATIDTSHASLNPSGVIPGEQVTLVVTGASGTFSNQNVGSAINVNVSGLTLAGADAGKYRLVQPTTTADITPAPLTVTGVTASDKVYDGTTQANFDTSKQALSGVVTTDVGKVILVGSAYGSFSSKNVGPHTINVTGLSISGPSASNYSLTQPSPTANITAAHYGDGDHLARQGVRRHHHGHDRRLACESEGRRR